MSEVKNHKFLWRYFTAMMTEKKDGVMAISLTRVSAIGWGIFLVTIITLRLFGVISELPSEILLTVAGIYGGLVGLKAVRDTINTAKGNDPYSGSGPGGA